MPQWVYSTHQSKSPQKFPTLWNLTATLADSSRVWVRFGNKSRFLSSKLTRISSLSTSWRWLLWSCSKWKLAYCLEHPSCWRGRNVQEGSVNIFSNLLFTPLLIMWQFVYMQNKKRLSTFCSVLLELSRKVCMSCNEVGDWF